MRVPEAAGYPNIQESEIRQHIRTLSPLLPFSSEINRAGDQGRNEIRIRSIISVLAAQAHNAQEWVDTTLPRFPTNQKDITQHVPQINRFHIRTSLIEQAIHAGSHIIEKVYDFGTRITQRRRKRNLPERFQRVLLNQVKVGFNSLKADNKVARNAEKLGIKHAIIISIPIEHAPIPVVNSVGQIIIAHDSEGQARDEGKFKKANLYRIFKWINLFTANIPLVSPMLNAFYHEQLIHIPRDRTLLHNSLKTTQEILEDQKQLYTLREGLVQGINANMRAEGFTSFTQYREQTVQDQQRIRKHLRESLYGLSVEQKWKRTVDINLQLSDSGVRLRPWEIRELRQERERIKLGFYNGMIAQQKRLTEIYQEIGSRPALLTRILSLPQSIRLVFQRRFGNNAMTLRAEHTYAQELRKERDILKKGIVASTFEYEYILKQLETSTHLVRIIDATQQAQNEINTFEANVQEWQRRGWRTLPQNL